MARDCIADRLKRPAHATMNKIFIHDLRLDTKVGVYEWERKLAQTVRIDVDIGLPSSRPFETGELADAIDYAIGSPRHVNIGHLEIMPTFQVPGGLNFERRAD